MIVMMMNQVKFMVDRKVNSFPINFKCKIEVEEPLFRVTPKLFGRWEYDRCEDDLDDFGDDEGNKKKRGF